MPTLQPPILWLGKPRLRGERTANSQRTLFLYLRFSFLIAAVRVGFQVPADQYHSHFFTGEVNSWITFHRWPPNVPHYVFDTLLDTLCKLRMQKERNPNDSGDRNPDGLSTLYFPNTALTLYRHSLVPFSFFFNVYLFMTLQLW